MTYRDADAEYSRLVDDSATLRETLPLTTFPETYRTLFGFCDKSRALKDALFGLIDANNSYAFKLVFRCFCEHYVKFTYVWLRFMEEKSDRVGTEYRSYCGAAETRDYVNAVVAAQAVTGQQMSAAMASAISGLFPEGAGMSPRELEEVSGQFEYSTMLRYVTRSSSTLLAAERPFLATIAPEYALLASFVHGGPHTDLDLEAGREAKALGECRERTGLVFQMTAKVFILTTAAISREFPEHASIATKASSLLNRFRASDEPERAVEERRSLDLDDKG